MATPKNLLEQLVMGLQTPITEGQPVFPETSTQDDRALAALLAQSLQAGESVPPAAIVRKQLANDLGITEEDLTLNLFGTQNRIQLGDPEVGSLLQSVAQDRGLPVEDMRQIVRGNVNLANVDAARGASLTSEPTKDEVLDGLLAEARGVTERNDPDAKAAFENKLGRLMRDPDVTPAEKEAAYQLRHPDMHVEMQPDGIMSFSDRGPGLQPKDEATRRAVENVRSKLETLSPDQAIVAGEGSNIAALAATTRMRATDAAIDNQVKLFGPPASKAASDIQNQLQSIVDIQDPNERFMALQRLGPSIAAYSNQRRAEIRNEVFTDFNIPQMERDLAEQEARDRADPKYDIYRRDSSYTSNVRQQLRVAKGDALNEISNRLETDPMLTTLKSQTAMTEAFIQRMDQRDLQMQFPDIIGSMDQGSQGRVRAAAQAMNPNLDVKKLSDSELAKIYSVDEDFYAAAASLSNPADVISTLVLDPKRADKWEGYMKQLERERGMDEFTAGEWVKRYKTIANEANTLLTKQVPEKELRNEGGAVRALVEQWKAEGSLLSPSERSARMKEYYLPKIIEAKLDYEQDRLIAVADTQIKDLKPQTSNEKVNRLLQEASDKGLSLGDLMDPAKLESLPGALVTGGEVRQGGSILVTAPRTLGILQDAEARSELAKYIALRRKERMATTSFLEPRDTYEDVHRKLQASAVTGRKYSTY